ncbi:hypothetical protein DMUE_3664 [Dictyocoela muelleri]|nr:hypothetical protein DMUE_3664 [Dictyocoela muelleri]
MKSKTQETYKMIFMDIKEMINCSPKMLIMDFEISVFNAFRNVFPDIETRGCNFHFSKIVVKFMNENKILPFYKNEDNFKTFIKYLMILDFVPEEKAEEEFANLKLLRKEMQECELIYNFFERNFIKK